MTAHSKPQEEQEQIRKERKGRRKHLDERLRNLHQRALVIEQQLRELEDGQFYRVCIFGSARIKPDSVE